MGGERASEPMILPEALKSKPLYPYVVMEVKQNLLEADRTKNIQRFCDPRFKKIAHVVMGDPSKDFKARVHKKLLEEKQVKVEQEWRIKKNAKELKRKTALENKKLMEMQQAPKEEVK